MTNNLLNNTTIAEKFGHSLDPYFAIPLAIYFVIIVIFAVFFNTALIITLISEKKLYTITNIYIINLAVGDLLTAVTTIPFDVDFLIRTYYPYGMIPCGFKEVVFMLSLPSSVINLLLLTIERFISIHYPFKRVLLFNKINVSFSITFGWIYSIIVGIFPLFLIPNAIIVTKGNCLMIFPGEYAMYQLFVNFTFPVVFILTLNITLFTIAHKHQKEIQKLTVVIPTEERQCSQNTKSNLKTAKTVFLLVGNFLICWLTFIVLTTANVSCNGCLPRQVTWLSNAVNYSNVVINPLLYGLLNKPIRRSLLKKLSKLFSLCCNIESNKPQKREYSTVLHTNVKNSPLVTFRCSEVTSPLEDATSSMYM